MIGSDFLTITLHFHGAYLLLMDHSKPLQLLDFEPSLFERVFSTPSTSSYLVSFTLQREPSL